MMTRANRNSVALAMLVTGIALLAGCSDDSTNPPGGGGGGASLFVVNSLGETIDRISLSTGQVAYNVMATGTAPNDLILDDAAESFWLANSGSNDVWKIDQSTLGIEEPVDLGTNQNPYNLALRADHSVAATNWLSGEVTQIAPNGTITQRFKVGRNPEAIVEMNGRLYVTAVAYDFPSNTYGPGKVYRLNGAGNAIADSAVVPLNPQALIPGPNGTIHVVCTGNYGFYQPAVDGVVRVLNAATLAFVADIPVGHTPGHGLLANGKVYLTTADGKLMKYDAATRVLERDADHSILTGAPGLGALAYDATTQRLYVTGSDYNATNKVYCVDTTTDTLLASWDVGLGPVALALWRAKQE